jgi:hypothetical protein
MALIIMSFFVLTSPARGVAENQWDMAVTYETPVLANSPFFLIAAADLNRNGRKEVVAADFGQYGSHFDEWKQWREWPVKAYSLFVLEWKDKALDVVFKKRWDLAEHKGERFYQDHHAFQAKRLVPFTVGDRTVVEAIPPYVGLEWGDGKYELHELKGGLADEPPVGSWIFPWVSPSCYQGFAPDIGPKECILAIRDFDRDGRPEVLTKHQEKINRRNYKQILRIRSYGNGSPILWEKIMWPDYLGLGNYQDEFNEKSYGSLSLASIRTNKYYVFLFNKEKRNYDFIEREIEHFEFDDYDIFDSYMRNTRDKNINELWGYIRLDSEEDEAYMKYREKKDVSFIMMLRRVTFNDDFSAVESADMEFPHHKNFYGVGYFDLGDLDGDGLDELVLVEETAGGIEPSREVMHGIDFKDVKDYIRILKWDGKEYKPMWVSPPYTKRLTKFLIADVKGTGQNQLVVLTPYGTVQIWEMKK